MLILLLFYAGGEICYSQVQIVYVLSDIFLEVVDSTKVFLLLELDQIHF